MTQNQFAVLEAATSREAFAAAIASLARDAGAERFAVFLLHGGGYALIAEVIHDGGLGAEHHFRVDRHATVDAMLNTMRTARPPRVFGVEPLQGLAADGYGSGVAAIARGRNSACVVYFGADVEAASPEGLHRLMATAQLCAVHALAALPAPAVRPCPLSDREMDCLQLFAVGLSPKTISSRLGISVGTVRNHLDRARIRCGLDSTIAVCALAMTEGWFAVYSAAAQ